MGKGTMCAAEMHVLMTSVLSARELYIRQGPVSNVELPKIQRKDKLLEYRPNGRKWFFAGHIYNSTQ